MTSNSLDLFTEQFKSVSWPVARYRFELRVTRSIRFQSYAGSALRGVFGLSLRKTACMTHMKECCNCPLFRTCPYASIFESPVPGQHELQKFSQIPAPYIIEPPEIGERIYQPKEILKFNVVLIGKALKQLPLIIYSMQRAFRRGVGYGTADLERVVYVSDGSEIEVFSQSDTVVSPHDPKLTLKEPSENLNCQISTPLKIQLFGKPLTPETFDTRTLLVSLMRRLSLLVEFHTDIGLIFPHTELSQLATTIQSTHSLQWFGWIRHSNRQKQFMHMGGVIGDISFVNVPEIFALMLDLSQYVHIGKNATFGMGKLKML